MRAALALGVLALGACPLPQQTPRSDGEAATGAPRIVVAEKGRSGGRLVVVAENGERVAELLPHSDDTIDVSPAYSPDGAWIAFASSRDRKLGETSLWIVAARPDSTPVRLTRGEAMDLTPTWTPDGRAIVFASTREGSLDLWRIPLSFEGGTVTGGALERLTDLPGGELSPSIAPDGRIAFTLIESSRARIGLRAPDGAISDLTSGPADTGPSFTPDGASISFTAPHVRAPGAEGEQPEVDGDLWLMPSSGGKATLLVDAPATDETGAVWSKDARWVFATSVYRSVVTGKPLFSSIVFVDRLEKSPTVRMLVDPAGAVPRIAVALAPVVLDSGALHDAPVYRDQLAELLQRAVDEQQETEPQ